MDNLFDTMHSTTTGSKLSAQQHSAALHSVLQHHDRCAGAHESHFYVRMTQRDKYAGGRGGA